MPIPTTVILRWQCDVCGRQDEIHGTLNDIAGLKVLKTLPDGWRLVASASVERVVCDHHVVAVGAPYPLERGKAISISWPLENGEPINVTGTRNPDGSVSFVVPGSMERT